MVMFFDGTDTLKDAALTMIAWKITYEMLKGEAEDNALMRSLIGEGTIGQLTLNSSLTGWQTVLDWGSEAGKIYFIISHVQK